MNRMLPSLFATLLLLPTTSEAGFFDKLKEGLDSGKFDIGQTLQSAKQAFGQVSQEQEDAIGKEAVAVLLGAVPLLDNDPLQRYVNRVGHWVALHTERRQSGASVSSIRRMSTPSPPPAAISSSPRACC